MHYTSKRRLGYMLNLVTQYTCMLHSNICMVAIYTHSYLHVNFGINNNIYDIASYVI